MEAGHLDRVALAQADEHLRRPDVPRRSPLQLPLAQLSEPQTEPRHRAIRRRRAAARRRRIAHPVGLRADVPRLALLERLPPLLFELLASARELELGGPEARALLRLALRRERQRALRVGELRAEEVGGGGERRLPAARTACKWHRATQPCKQTRTAAPRRAAPRSTCLP
jgi:hypothetical protein